MLQTLHLGMALFIYVVLRECIKCIKTTHVILLKRHRCFKKDNIATKPNVLLQKCKIQEDRLGDFLLGLIADSGINFIRR